MSKFLSIQIPSVDTALSTDTLSPTLFKKKDSKSYKIYIDASHSMKEKKMKMKIRNDDGKEKDLDVPLFNNYAPFAVSETLANYPSMDNVKMGLDLIRKQVNSARNLN
jgi:hypothetical protein